MDWSVNHAPLRERLIGRIQRQVVRLLLRSFSPTAVTTSIPVYQWMLARLGTSSEILSLFGNVPVVEPVDELFEAPALAKMKANRKQLWIGLFFGAIHEPWQPEPLIGNLVEAAEAAGKKLALLVVGRSGSAGLMRMEEIRAHYSSAVEVLEFGEQPTESISTLLQFADFGIATTPRLLIGKSGSAQAMLEHGLPVYVTRNDWRPAGYEEANLPDDFNSLIFEPNVETPSWPRFEQQSRAVRLIAKELEKFLLTA